MHDGELIRDYVDRKSEAAFTQLVERYLNFVYSACRRMLDDAQLAEDATQIVFLSLAKHAPSLRSKVSVGGWLYTAARFSCSNLRRGKQRRETYEEQAARETMNGNSIDDGWKEMAPLLEDAMQSLRPADREALILRFFQGCSLQETGEALGVSEEAARKRMGRALDKLRAYFVRHGVTLSGALLVAIITNRAVEAAPITAAGIMHSVKSALVIGAAGSSITSGSEGVLKMMWLGKAKAASAVAAVIIGGAVAVAAAHGLHKTVPPALVPVNVRVTVPDSARAVKLPGGITVDLVAINPTVDGNGEQWWDADGKWLSEAPGRNNAFHHVHYESGMEGNPLSLLLKITGPDRSKVGTIGYVVDPDGQMDNLGYIVKGAPEEDGWISSRESATGCMPIRLPADMKTFDYWFGVADGPWYTTATTRFAAPKLEQLYRPSERFASSVIVTLGDHPEISYKDASMKWHRQSLLGASAPLGAVDRWVTAVDADGKDIQFNSPQTDRHGVRSVTMDPEDLAKVAEFRLQTRPYMWAEFKDVHAKPLIPAPTRVLVDPMALPAYKHTFDSGIGIQLTVVHRFPLEGGEWWLPDGQALSGTPRSYQQESSSGATANAHVRIIGYTLSGPPGSTCNIVWRARGTEDSHSDSLPGRELDVNRALDRTDGLRYYNEYPANPATTDLKVGLAGGPWKTVATKDVQFTPEKLAHRDVKAEDDEAGDITIKMGSDIRLQYMTPDFSPGDELIATPDLSKMAYRLVFVMQDGSSIPISESGQSVDYRLYSFAFDHKSSVNLHNPNVDITKVRQIQVQSRPYEWTKFPGVALKPGK